MGSGEPALPPLNHAELVRRLRLVVITDAELSASLGLEHVVDQALRAGAPTIQLRMKNTSARELLRVAAHILPRTRSAGALLIVNDRLDVALAAGADGVHLGPEDPPVREVRDAVTPDFLVGYSADTPEAAVRAEENGADYVGVGAVYTTTNKADAGETLGLAGLRRVVQAVTIPVVGIGGITAERVPEVTATGAHGIAVIGAVMASGDPAQAVRDLLTPFDPQDHQEQPHP